MWGRFKTLDPWLFLAPLLLCSVSVVVIYTLTIETAGPSLYQHQLLYAIVGVILMLVATFFDYRNLKAWAPWLYAGGLAALVAVRLFGKSDFGAQRWINIGFFQLQPSEIEKVILIVCLAALLGKKSQGIPLSRFLLALLAIALPSAAVLLQPDLGTAIVLVASGFGMLFSVSTNRLQKGILLGLIIAGALVFTLSFKGVRPFSGLLKDYQKKRLISFVQPSADPGGSGYNILQSVIAVGSGGVMGKGLGAGTQSTLNFLPVAHADFIFAGIAEAWGFVGSLTIIGLFSWLMLRIVHAARIAKDDFGTILCVGIVIKILVEVVVNVGMNIRLMPVTGIPLPFLSYGGTTLITNLLAVGIVQSAVIRYKRLTF